MTSPGSSIELERAQAITLLAAVRRGDRAATDRFLAHHPRLRDAHAVQGAALHDARLVIAREHGFASWPRWKQFAEARQLDAGGQAALLVRAACEGDMRFAAPLLAADPSLERFDFYTACACGAVDHVERLLDHEPSLARRRGGPLDREPLLYACFSRFLRIEVVPVQPGPEYVWVPGHWTWRPRRANYVWVPGRWAIPGSPGAAWVPGRWVSGPHGYAWVEGHWRVR